MDEQFESRLLADVTLVRPAIIEIGYVTVEMRNNAKTFYESSLSQSAISVDVNNISSYLFDSKNNVALLLTVPGGYASRKIVYWEVKIPNNSSLVDIVNGLIASTSYPCKEVEQPHYYTWNISGTNKKIQVAVVLTPDGDLMGLVVNPPYPTKKKK